MVWTGRTQSHEEAAKIRFECVPYVSGARGIDIGLEAKRWSYPHAVPVEAVTLDNIDRLSVFADAAFEFVFSSYTLPAFEDPVGVLTAWWRMLKPDGYLLLYLPHAELYPAIGDERCDARFRRHYDADELLAAMAEVAPDWDCVENQRRNGREESASLQVYRKAAPGSGQAQSWRQPAPEKRAAVVRYGAYGDALWASSILPALKDEGYHVTVYTQTPGAQALRYDPHVDRIIEVTPHSVSAEDLIAHWQWERVKYQRWINLLHSVEARLLWTPTDVVFHAPDSVRRQCGTENYLEAVHRFAEVPYVPRQKFYPTASEMEQAKARRATYAGPVVVLNPHGSTWPKWWPYTERFAALLAEAAVHTVVLGDWRGEPAKLPARYGHFIGKQWSMREAMTFAQVVDCVVGEESALVNAVAFEPVPKVVLMSHSMADNLTRDWIDATAIEPVRMPCHPCYRIHKDQSFCVFEKRTQSAGCQAIILPETVAELVLERIGVAQRESA